jgi:hypothetical protein
MNKLRVASVALLVVASTGLMFGSMGFSSVAADRGVSVAVADDDSALVGYDSGTVTVTGNERVDLVTVTNRLSSEAAVANVTVSTSDDDVEVTNVSKPSLDPGEVKAIAADVHCPGNRDVTVTVSVTVEGEGVTAAISGDTTTRSFELACGGHGPDSGPRFTGAGNFQFDAMDAETVNVTYWTASNQSGTGTVDEQSNTSEVETATNLGGQVDGPRFVAVYVHETDTTYVHPGLDRANETVDWGTGGAVVEDGQFDPTAD